jgi:hypothetical protein
MSFDSQSASNSIHHCNHHFYTTGRNILFAQIVSDGIIFLLSFWKHYNLLHLVSHRLSKYCRTDELFFNYLCLEIVVIRIRVAQRKRGGPITHRSEDRNLALIDQRLQASILTPFASDGLVGFLCFK